MALGPGILVVALAASASTPQARAGTVVTVRQSGQADFVGNDRRTLVRALARLEQGGTLLVGPGRYVLRRTLSLPADLVIRGEPGCVLALPSPGLTRAPAAAGASEIVLQHRGEFAADGEIAIFPPPGSELMPDGESRGLGPLALASVEGERLVLAEPLALDVPAGSRVSYPLKLLRVHRAGRLTLENLTFDGGRTAGLPMPGHFLHCGVWASPPTGSRAAGEPSARDVVVRHCRFTDWYGRAIALYDVTDSLIEGSLFERIADEAIDLDHYCQRVRVLGNQVRDAQRGIVLNDASRCTVAYNSLEDCGIGIHAWWFERIAPDGLNEENLVRCNVVRGSREASVLVDRACHRNVLEHNFVDRAIRAVEPTNALRGNTLLR